MWSIRPGVDQLKIYDRYSRPKLKKVNFDTALIQNQLNDGGDFEVRFGTDFLNSTVAFF